MYLLCDMYNITDTNNKFYLLEKTNKYLITIPIGFYNIDRLLEIITKAINLVSENKTKDYKYSIYRNKIKNKVYISCDWITSDKDKNSTKRYPLNFGILFINNSHKIQNYSLNEILGFNKYEYIANNIYIGEKMPIENIYQNIYFKLFINDKEIERYYTTKENFSYYDKIFLNLNENYGNNIYHKPNIEQRSNLNETTDMIKISFQFNNSIQYIINFPLNFEIIMGFQY